MKKPTTRTIKQIIVFQAEQKMRREHHSSITK